MNTKKENKAENEQPVSQDNKSQRDRLLINAQRLLREQRDMARITTFGRRDE